VYQTWLVLSIDSVHETEIWAGLTDVAVIVGGGAGGVVSGGVV
jgi:hypothetical protein